MGPLLQGLTYPDVVALALASGVKLGGGDWTKALLWGFGSRFVLSYLGFAQTPCTQQDQSNMSAAGTLFRSFVGAVGVGTVNQPATASGNRAGPVIDAQFETQGQQVPTPGQ